MPFNEVDLSEISLFFSPEIASSASVEDALDLFIKSHRIKNNTKSILVYKSVVNEAFVNAIKHTANLKKRKNIPVSFSFSSGDLTISVSDFGKGLRINNTYPPYSKTMIDKIFDFYVTCEGTVRTKIIDPWNVILTYEDSLPDKFNRLELIKKIPENGRGLNIMIKIMDSVRYQYSHKNYNTLILSKLL